MKVKGKGNFGIWMASEMRKADITKEDLAEVLDMSTSQLTSIINMVVKTKKTTIIAILWALNQLDKLDMVMELYEKDFPYS